MSWSRTLSKVMKPSPVRENTASTTTAPASSSPTMSASMVIDGIEPLRSTCRSAMARSLVPFARSTVTKGWWRALVRPWMRTWARAPLTANARVAAGSRRETNALVPDGRDPAEPEREHRQQREADEEARRGDGEHGHGGRRAAQPAPRGVHRGERHGEGERDGEAEGEGSQADRVDDALQEQLADRTAADQREAEVAGEEPPDGDRRTARAAAGRAGSTAAGCPRRTPAAG